MFTLTHLNYDHINFMFIYFPILTRNVIDVYVNKVYPSVMPSPNIYSKCLVNYATHMRRKTKKRRRNKCQRNANVSKDVDCHKV